MYASKIVAGLLSFLLVSGYLGAQEPAAVDPGAQTQSFGLGFGLGTQQINGKTFQSLSMVTDVGLGPFGVGLDIKLNYQFYRRPGDAMGFYVRPQDWIVDKNDDGVLDEGWSPQEMADIYLSKIVYLRYGLKGQPLYAKIGLFEDGTLGNGFIMGNYSNGVLRPAYTYVGLAFDLDGVLFGFPYVGLETFTNSISTYDLLGGRVYVRPLKMFNIPVFGDLQIGGTVVTDTDPYAIYRKTEIASTAKDNELATYGGSQVLVYGGDFRQPLVNLPGVFSLALFGDLVKQKDAAGGMVGLGGNLLVLNYSSQLRILGENFQAVYFDRSYDLSRVSKLKTYNNYADHKVPAFNGWYFQIGTNLLDGQIAFSSSIEGPLGTVATPDPTGALLPKIRSTLKLDGTKLLPVPISLTGYYDKDKIADLSSIFSPEDALIGATLSYKIGAATLNLVYDVRYIPQEKQVPGSTSNFVVTSKLETAISLF